MDIGATELVTGNVIRVNKVQRIPFSGRFTLNTDQRWVSWPNNGGAYTNNWTQNLGTGAEPNSVWTVSGPFSQIGDRIKRVIWWGRCNNADVTGIDVRLNQHSGPFGAADSWNSNAETVSLNVLSEDNVQSSNHWDINEFSTDVQMTANGILVLAMRPTNVPGANRQYFINGMIEVEHVF